MVGVFTTSRLLIAGHLAILLSTKWPMKIFFLVVWQAIVITRPFSSIRHTVQCSVHKTLFFDMLKNIRSPCLGISSFDLLFFYGLSKFLINFCVCIHWPIKKIFCTYIIVSTLKYLINEYKYLINYYNVERICQS